MPPKKQLAVDSQAGPSRGASRGSRRGRGAASTRGASGRARGGRGTAARGKRSTSTAGDGDTSDTFLGKLVQNPGMMGDFMKFYGKLAKALDKRGSKRRAQRLGLAGDDDDEEDSDEDSDLVSDEDSDQVSDEDSDSPGDDLDGFTHRALAGMAAKMGGVSDLREPGAPRDCSDDDDSSDGQDEMDEVVHTMTSEEESSEDEADPALPAARVKYVRFRDEEFAAAVAAAPRISRLSLAKLMRTRSDDYLLGEAKRDKHVEAVLKALGSGTKDVAALHLEDAEWATCKLYSPLLVRLLASYKDSLRTLSMTNRLLLQPNNGKKGNCIWKVVSTMPHLEELRLTYVSLSLHYFTYRGELRKDDWLPKEPKKAVLTALKRIHLHLTPDWFERQFHIAIDGGSDYEDFEYENVGGGEREEEQEDFLEDLLKSKGDAVTTLDMACVKKTTMELEIVDLLASLHKVRTISLRVELLHVTKAMAELAAASVVFDHDPAPGAAAVAEAAALITSASAPWASLQQLTFLVPSKATSATLFSRAAPKRARKVQAAWNQVLTAAAATCCSLKLLALEGDGWAPDALHQVLDKNPSLQMVLLDETAELEPRHLALLKDMAALKHVQLNPALRKAKEGTELAGLVAQCLAEWTRRGVRVQWGKKGAA